MSWRLLDRPKTQKVTRVLARQFAEMEPAPHDRPLSERRLTVYEKLLAAGQFRPVTWASAICLETGEVYRVNGKHTSTMLSGLEKLPDFYVTIEEYECDGLDDVAKLYATFDSSMQSRTANDIYLSFAATMKELANCTKKAITLTASAVPYHLHGGALNYGQPADRAEYLLEYPEFVIWLDRLTNDAPTASEQGTGYGKGHGKQKMGHLLRSPVVAAMFAGWLKSKSAATEFWGLVRDESSPTPSSPDRKIARYLMTVGLHRGELHGKAKVATQKELYCKCLHAWNAWRKGETTNLNYYADAKLPVAQ